jgi:hypothetical protein
MPLRAVDPCRPQHLPLGLSRPAWELPFASVRARLEQTVAVGAEEARPAEAMRRMRVDVLECVAALGKLQILMVPARAGFREPD